MYRISGVRRPYDWGSHDAIPWLMGEQVTDEPVAELWFGVHPTGPAGLPEHDEHDNLKTLIESDPVGTLGEDVKSRFGDTLPFLMKLIAPAKPLSLQVHPNLTQAREGFKREEAAGIALDDPTRNYRDPNHKPELVIALTRLEAMCGFRAPRRAIELLEGLDVPLAERLVKVLRDDPTSAGMKRAFALLISGPRRATPEDVKAIAEACAHRLATSTSPSPRADTIVGMLHDEHPGDPGVVAALLLNPVTLRGGETLFVSAGTVHAYLSGLAVEVMASSDNVLRAGLTSKHVDIDEMLQCVDFVAAPPIRLAPELFGSATEVFYAPVDDFELNVTRLRETHGRQPVRGLGPRVILCVDGKITLWNAADERVQLRCGQAVFVPAGDGAIEAKGSGTLVQVDVP
ncbi:mannose-6-phosphate isomerase, class I [Bowdeniella nasicola]|uniref:mannose-6-phosphate isomerase n=1 Tax=Bowdeniella nasicola TaxID=208480 RepID=A0A1Q5Q059_9ACTO|nr:mannose-6-phosphate isomerase, class I [Bowdeniella nasicola]OKL53261.1 mannose-6-phosphate isomerase, class I [Bowdeniella nasicola]